MFEDILEVKTSKKDLNKPHKLHIVEDVNTCASWDAMEHHAVKPHIIRRGFEKAFESIGIDVSITFELLDKREGEEAPRWCFHLKLKDYEEN